MELPKDTPRVAWATKTRARLQAWWAKIPRRGRWIVLAVIALGGLGLLYIVPGTGFGAATWTKSDKLEYRPAKTLWDLLGLLIIPLLAAAGGWWFTHWNEKQTREAEQRQRGKDRELAEDRLREDVLQK
jgi:hypothetical protein